MDFPQLYKNDDGVELIALNDVQADAFEKGGFAAAGKYGATDEEVTELDDLKSQADELGIEYSANIGAKTLKERIEKHLADE